MRSYILLALVLFVGCRDRDRLQRITKCGQPCYTLSGKADVGQCSSGVWVCTGDDEETATCEQQVGPSSEVCDKGKRISQVDDLSWLRDTLEKDLGDSSKAQYHDKCRAQIASIDAELARRGGGGGRPAAARGQTQRRAPVEEDAGGGGGDDFDDGGGYGDEEIPF
jgi:hypothetical protein